MRECKSEIEKGIVCVCVCVGGGGGGESESTRQRDRVGGDRERKGEEARRKGIREARQTSNIVKIMASSEIDRDQHTYKPQFRGEIPSLPPPLPPSLPPPLPRTMCSEMARYANMVYMTKYTAAVWLARA